MPGQLLIGTLILKQIRKIPDVKYTTWGINELNQNYDKTFLFTVGFNLPHIPWYVPQKCFEMNPIDIVLPKCFQFIRPF